MRVPTLKKIVKRIFRNNPEHDLLSTYFDRYERYAFTADNCKSFEQFEGYITRLYHTIEKGLSYTNYRPGFGKANIDKLLDAMEKYSISNDISAAFYKTALSVLNAYIEKNKKFGVEDIGLEGRIKRLPGQANDEGGIIRFKPLVNTQNVDFKTLIKARHSIRHFSDEEVDLQILKAAIQLSQFTPSACNRQGWKTRIIANEDIIKEVLSNQNGNRGFGNEIDKLLIVTSDLRYFNRDREVFQAFIDGGMYAMNVINSLAYYGVAHIPLSASLTSEQEKIVRHIVGIDESEVLILIIGVGNYPDDCQTTRSERKSVNPEVI